eukprot:TRINITY_DN3879_c0_g6_i1.p1 TRINITY_DN3879_c0_g6~~TRINITY_DN3879_c0_g6_i1.p1  ORF type:complete len:529 (+),score=68.40 TRINITY_DN3879_c0_g6_i1:94-1680(+)
MISYAAGKWQLSAIMRCTGSVFPRALVFGIPAAIMAAMIHWGGRQLEIPFHEFFDATASGQIWVGYNFALSFLLIFRTQNAYERYWEGGLLLTRTSGYWRSAISSCVAFCDHDPQKVAEVKAFQKRLMQLASLLHCTMLQEVADLKDENFEVIDMSDLDQTKLRLLMLSGFDRCGMCMQWVQKLISRAQLQGTIIAPAPIVSRCFQELSQGLIAFHEAFRIRDILFPFPYLQVVQCVLILTTVLTPLVNVIVLNSAPASVIMTFISITAFWSINYIAAEIEMPFGDDPNDLPVRDMQDQFNDYLLMLVQPELEEPPQSLSSVAADPADIHLVPFSFVERTSIGRGVPIAMRASTSGRVTRKEHARADAKKHLHQEAPDIAVQSGVADKGLEPSHGTSNQDAQSRPAQSIEDESPVAAVTATGAPEPDPDRVDLPCDPDVQDSRLAGADKGTPIDTDCRALISNSATGPGSGAARDADDSVSEMIASEGSTKEAETARVLAQEVACRRAMVTPGGLMAKTLADETKQVG